VPGMLQRIGQPVDFAVLSTIPPPSRWMTVVKWAIPALIVAAFAFGYREHAGQGLMELVLAWGVPVAVGTTVFSLLGGSRILTALSGLVLGPAAALNPTLASGCWSAGRGVAAQADRRRLRECARGLQVAARRLPQPLPAVLLVSAMATLGTAIDSGSGSPGCLRRCAEGRRCRPAVVGLPPERGRGAVALPCRAGNRARRPESCSRGRSEATPLAQRR